MAWLPTHTFDGILCMGPLRERPPEDGSVVETVEVDGRTWWWRVCATCGPVTPALLQKLIEATRAKAAVQITKMGPA